VDGGANIGASSIFFALKFPDAGVVAIEPEFGNYQVLAENVKGLDITPIHAAVSATNRRVRVVDVGEGFWGYQTQPLEEGQQGVRGITLQQVYEMYSTECFPFITKIDIEGGEKDLFSANVDWVRQTPLVIVELHDWLLPRQGSSRPFLQCVAGLDRDFVYVGEDVYSIANDLDQREEDQSVSRIGSVEEPLDDDLVNAMKDFQNHVITLRSSDAELRAALSAAQAEREQTRQLLASARADLQRAERELADNQRQLANATQDVSDLQAREKALVEELSSAIASLQQLRDQLDERNAMLAETQNELAGLEEQLERRNGDEKRKLAAEAATRQKLEVKLRKRSDELTAFRQRKLVRVAIKIGNWLHRRPVQPAR
jgi:FkbM family methyltransferase